jgi:O-antigen/teichoic acid export membrane protein
MMSACRGEELRRLSDQSLRWLLLTATPITLLIIVFSHDLLYLWVGPQIAKHGAPAMQWLALGVLINVLAQVPQTALQASGRAKIVGIIQLLELPLYAALALWLILQYGITGAAVAWSVRAAVEGLVLSFAFRRVETHPDIWPGTSLFRLVLLAGSIIGCWLIAGIAPLATKCALALFLVGGLSMWQWRYLLTAGEREMLLARVKRRAR